MFEFKIATTRWGYAETDTTIAPIVVVSIFTDLLLGTQLIKQQNWSISFSTRLHLQFFFLPIFPVVIACLFYMLITEMYYR